MLVVDPFEQLIDPSRSSCHIKAFRWCENGQFFNEVAIPHKTQIKNDGNFFFSFYWIEGKISVLVKVKIFQPRLVFSSDLTNVPPELRLSERQLLLSPPNIWKLDTCAILYYYSNNCQRFPSVWESEEKFLYRFKHILWIKKRKKN